MGAERLCCNCKYYALDIYEDIPCRNCDACNNEWVSKDYECRKPKVKFEEILLNPRHRYKHSTWYSNEYYNLKSLLEILSRYNESDIVSYITFNTNSYWIEE